MYRMAREKIRLDVGRLICDLAFDKGHDKSASLCSQLLYCTFCVRDAELLATFELPR